MDACLWANSFLSKAPRLGAEPSREWPRVPACSFMGSCPGTIPSCPHPKPALSLLQMRQEWEARIWEVSLKLLP